MGVSFFKRQFGGAFEQRIRRFTLYEIPLTAGLDLPDIPTELDFGGTHAHARR